MFLDIFDLDGDGKLNAVEMAAAYTVIFGEGAWSGTEREENEEPEEDDPLPDSDDSYSDDDYGC